MKKLHHLLRPILALCLFCAATLTAHAEWTTTGEMNVDRNGHTATLLPDGNVLVAKGYGGFNHQNQLTSSELYDFTTGTWTPTGDTGYFGNGHTATLLLNGKVLIAGGFNDIDVYWGYQRTSKLYDPTSKIWQSTGLMNIARFDHTATRLANGKILVVGGRALQFSQWVSFTSAEIYDPETGTWTMTGAMTNSRFKHTATLLPNGKVLVVGGLYNGNSYLLDELYDPEAGTWSIVSQTKHLYGSATLLKNGKVLFAGGDNYGAALFDTLTNTMTDTTPTNFGYSDHTATLLPNGRVLVVGGNTNHVEIYDPENRTWTVKDSMTTSRLQHAATLLPNGKVLVSGGISSNNTALWSAELYSSFPKFNLQPSGIIIYQGRHNTFTTSSSGDDLTYQWKKGGIEIQGATFATLTLSNVQPADAGEYTVVVSNSSGSVTSNAATLTVIPDADGDGLSDADETDIYHTDPTKADTDGDGLTDFAEVQTHGTNPLLTDTDGDGFTDAYEIQTGKSLTSATDKPLLVAEVRTAIEFSFPSATGKTYRVEGSADLANWSTVEDGIAGTGAGVTRFYSTRNTPTRFFRVAESANP